MEKFCKLYETKEYGQILVMLQSNSEDEHPEIRVFAKPPKLGICSLAFGYANTDAGWDTAEEMFKTKFSVDEVKPMVKRLFEHSFAITE